MTETIMIKALLWIAATGCLALGLACILAAYTIAKEALRN